MKKTIVMILIIISFICSGFAYAGCNNSYEIVSNVEFVTDGKKQTKSSVALPVDKGQLNWREDSYEEECSKVDSKYFLSSYGSYFYGVKLDKSKTLKSYYGLTENDFGCYVYWGEDKLLGAPGYLRYYKQRFYGWEYKYIYVKVINSKTIAIFDSDTDSSNATTYTVTSYKITRFYD